MNEIEYAIGILENNLLSASVCVDVGYAKKHNQVINLAIEALREKAERSRGCEFCCYTEYPDEKLYPKEGYTFYAGFYKQINVDAFDEGELEKLKFCPSCGKRLEVEP